MLCVPRISPDSPRFIQYFSRWLIPEKIAAAKKLGDFDEAVKNCPIFSPLLLDYIQAGIDEYNKFTGQQKIQPTLKSPFAQIVKVSANASR